MTPTPAGAAGANDTPTLSVVIPVYNEPSWIPKSVAKVVEALVQSSWRDPEIVIVDDGSTDSTPAVLTGLESPIPIRVVRTENQGRLLARRTGIEAATGEYVLLLDARVLVTSDLEFVAQAVRDGKAVWNGHCEVRTAGNLLATFWDSMPRIFWSAYYARPRELSYGIEDFVKYPKGTTCFLAPRQGLLDAYANFSTRYANARDANDDTSLIEDLARRYRIWISPDFACLYEPRQRLGRFGPHAYHRGIVFVDGYLKPGNPYAVAIVGFCVVSAGGLIAALRRPWLIPVAIVTMSLGAAAAGTVKRLPPGHIRALATIGPVFTMFYGAGIWAGIAMSVRNRLQPRRLGLPASRDQ